MATAPAVQDASVSICTASAGRATATPALEKLLPQLQAHLDAQLNLCSALEKIADELPHMPNRQTCLHTARSIYPIIKSAHQFEEEQLFPELRKAVQDGDASLEPVLQRLHGEHWEDESFGEELSEAIKEFVADREQNTDKLSYMLRGFFEGLRRHIAFEMEAFPPLLQLRSQ